MLSGCGMRLPSVTMWMNSAKVCGATLLFERYTTPDKTQKLLLAQLGLELPEQSPPRITSQQALEPLN